MISVRRSILACSLGLVLLGTQAVQAQEVVRHPVPDFPIAQSVEVPPGMTTVYVSGTVPPALPGTKEFGNTEVQTEGVFKNIERVLAKSGLKLGDVVKMQVFLVGDAAHGGKMDFAGFMTGYKKFFGTAEQPNLPARSVMQVAGLVNPGWLVEIEVTAVKAAK